MANRVNGNVIIVDSAMGNSFILDSANLVRNILLYCYWLYCCIVVLLLVKLLLIVNSQNLILKIDIYLRILFQN